MEEPGGLPSMGSHACVEEGNGNPLQYSCLENPRDREAWQAIVHRVAKSGTQLSGEQFNHKSFVWGIYHFMGSTFRREKKSELENLPSHLFNSFMGLTD